MKIEDIKLLAEKKADSQERRGTSSWNGFYYGYIFGYQDAFSERQTTNKGLDTNESKALSIADISTRFSIDAVAPIEDALYATKAFTTEQCSNLADGIIQYLKDAGFACIKVDIP